MYIIIVFPVEEIYKLSLSERKKKIILFGNNYYEYNDSQKCLFQSLFTKLFQKNLNNYLKKK